VQVVVVKAVTAYVMAPPPVDGVVTVAAAGVYGERFSVIASVGDQVTVWGLSDNVKVTAAELAWA
jgi:hypothetical protein